MTTKGVIGCSFKHDEGIRGMWINSDGLSEEIIKTICWNMRYNGWTLEKTMRIIFKEPLFYFGFCGSDLSLPRVYFGSGKMYYMDMERFEYIVRPEKLKNSEYLRIFDEMTSDGRQAILEWTKQHRNIGSITRVQLLANAAPETAGVCGYLNNEATALKLETERTNEMIKSLGGKEEDLIRETKPFDMSNDDRTSINQGGHAPDKYTVYVDVPNETFHWWDYDDDTDEETFTSMSAFEMVAKLVGQGDI